MAGLEGTADLLANLFVKYVATVEAAKIVASMGFARTEANIMVGAAPMVDNCSFDCVTMASCHGVALADVNFAFSGYFCLLFKKIDKILADMKFKLSELGIIKLKILDDLNFRFKSILHNLQI